MVLDLTEYDASQLDALVLLWREAFEFGVGFKDPQPLSELREYFCSEVLPINRVTLAFSSSQLVGFVAASAEFVDQLHVRVGHHRQGIGSALLALAKARSSGSLCLYTFARNLNACRFYEKHGFAVIERSFEPRWNFENVKYGCSAGASGGI